MNDDISIDVEETKINTTFIEISTHRSGSPPLLTPARPAGEVGTDLWRRRSLEAAAR
jgi:hypothetical protein